MQICSVGKNIGTVWERRFYPKFYMFIKWKKKSYWIALDGICSRSNFSSIFYFFNPTLKKLRVRSVWDGFPSNLEFLTKFWMLSNYRTIEPLFFFSHSQISKKLQSKPCHFPTFSKFNSTFTFNFITKLWLSTP